MIFKKQEELKKNFLTCHTEEEKYKKIINFGRSAPKIPPELKTPERIVEGCQSIVYLYSWEEEGKMRFVAESEALISAGLAAMLIFIYDKASPEAVIKIHPKVFDEIGLFLKLTPTRANGLNNMYLRMKRDALKILTNSH
ncbi:MAG: SufE family protein [Chlamydiae bacterium]|nr:SufE family protein [Chlamydiota bacterium]